MSSDAGLNSKHKHDLNASDTDEVAQLDAILDRIREKTPALPYIVSVPSGVPYKSAKTLYDFRDSKWTPEERHLEYSSYLYRNTASDGTILHLEAQGILNDVLTQDTPHPDPRPAVTNPNTPLLGPKKKVSLADYKKRAKEKASTPIASRDKTTETESHFKSPVTSAPSRATTHTTFDARQAAPHVVTSPTPQQQPESDGLLPPRAKRTVSGPAAQAPVPKSPSEHDRSPPLGQQSSEKNSVRTQKNLSQDMAPGQSATAARARGVNPGRQSTGAPTSPAGARSMAPVRARNEDVPSIQVDSIDSPLPDRLSPITSWEDLSGPADSGDSAAFLHSFERPFPAIDVYLDLPSDVAFRNARNVRQDADRTSTRPDQAKLAKSEGKGIANVKPDTLDSSQDRLSRKDEKLHKSTAGGEDANGESSNAKASKFPVGNAKPAEKRRRDDTGSDTDATAKRRKVNDTLQQNARSPSRTSAATTKPKPLPTPGKGSKRSAEEVTAEAPAAQRGSRAPADGSSKSTASAPRKWKAELSRLEGIGKQLKRQSQAKADKSAGRTERDRAVKLATVQGIESALCYMTAFCANDQIRPTHQSWRSLSPLLEELVQRAEGHAHLQGLCLLIRAACCSRSVSILNNVKPDSLQDAQKVKEHVVAVQTYVQRADEFAREANKHLTRAILAEAYPEAYRASDAIPLATPSPMPVVRMAIAFLAEWSQRQGLDWKPTFEEGECGRL